MVIAGRGNDSSDNTRGGSSQRWYWSMPVPSPNGSVTTVVDSKDINDDTTSPRVANPMTVTTTSARTITFPSAR